MKLICILSCAVLFGAFDPARASVLRTPALRIQPAFMSADTCASSDDEMDSCLPDSGRQDDFSADAAKKKAKKKKTRAS